MILVLNGPTVITMEYLTKFLTAFHCCWLSQHLLSCCINVIISASHIFQVFLFTKYSCGSSDIMFNINVNVISHFRLQINIQVYVHVRVHVYASCPVTLVHFYSVCLFCLNCYFIVCTVVQINILNITQHYYTLDAKL